MTDESFTTGGVRISDPQVMRALAHPARIEIIDYLNNTGAAVTATECASMVGLSPSATSYHLRELAKYGLVEQAPSRGDGRERIWRGVGASLRIKGDIVHVGAREAERALVDAYLTKDFQKLRDWTARQGDEPPVWRDASMLMRMYLLLSPEELIEVNNQVAAILEPYRQRERTEPPEDARRVLMHYSAFPED
jgi:DNA-binding transcriptional ArsR family regulator